MARKQLRAALRDSKREYVAAEAAADAAAADPSGASAGLVHAAPWRDTYPRRPRSVRDEGGEPKQGGSDGQGGGTAQTERSTTGGVGGGTGTATATAPTASAAMTAHLAVPRRRGAGMHAGP